jgi:hypothetical protein
MNLLMTRFSLLTKYLEALRVKSDRLSYKSIEKILTTKLPPIAYTNHFWWENDPNKKQCRGWLNAGWRVDDINLGNTITFKKIDPIKNDLEAGREPKTITLAYPQISNLMMHDKEVYHAEYNPGNGSLSVIGKIEYRWQIELLKRYLDGLHCKPSYELESPRFGEKCICGSNSWKEIGEYSRIDGPLSGIGFVLNQCDECKRVSLGSMWIS